MELTAEQLREFREEVVLRQDLSKNLLERFPDVEISIIRGHDNFSYEAYTSGAFFREEEAVQRMREIPPSGDRDLADTYHVIRCKLSDLEAGRIYDGKTKDPLDDIDRRMIYDFLDEKLAA